jgi:hypothetical protein
MHTNIMFLDIIHRPAFIYLIIHNNFIFYNSLNDAVSSSVRRAPNRVMIIAET